MSDRVKSKIPFVGLHAHSVAGALFDALGYPSEHMDFAYSNGCDALALTDHGNMNGFSYQLLHSKKMKADGKDFKAIFGLEAYFTTSVKEWKEAYDKARDAFIPPKTFNSWILNEETCLWEAPVALPDTENRYTWNEGTTSWDLVDNSK